MIVILKKTAERQQVELFENWLRSMGLELHKSVGENHTIIGLVGDASWSWQGPAPWRRRSRSSPWPSR